MENAKFTKLIRLFESVNNIKIPKNSLLKEENNSFFSNLPPGFSKNDFLSPEEVCDSNETDTAALRRDVLGIYLLWH